MTVQVIQPYVRVPPPPPTRPESTRDYIDQQLRNIEKTLRDLQAAVIQIQKATTLPIT